MVETATRLRTIFGSLDAYQKGSIELVSGSVKEYAFSNIFEVASHAQPYEKTVVGKNLEYVIEAVRAEGTSPWYTCAHDEFAIVMDGKLEIAFVKLDDAGAVAPENTEGTILVPGEPRGKKMGVVRLSRGHQALLPAGSAYRFTATQPGVFLQQTILGPLSRERWGEICIR
jgi:hypothetical protein